jgi:MFS family permease
VAQAITQTAQNAIWYALLVLVAESSHSSTQLGITILSVIIPSVLFGVPAGVYVDRWDKRTVLVVTNLARCAIVLGYIGPQWLLEARPEDPLVFGSVLALLYVVSFIFSVVSQFFAPAETAMIPAIVPKSRLLQANSFFQLTFTASQFAGLVLFGPLVVKLLGTTTFFVAMAALYGLSGLLVWRLPRDHQAVSDERANPLGQLVSQLREVGGMLAADRGMLWAMGYFTVAVALTLLTALLAPGYAVAVLGIAAADAVFVMAPAAIGIFIAAAALSRATTGPLADGQRVITAGLRVIAVSLACVGGLPAAARLGGVIQPEGYPVEAITGWHSLLIAGVMLATFVAGGGLAAVLVSAQTYIQERAPVEARGRVFAVQLTLANLVSVIPLLGAGGAADLMGEGGTSRVFLLLAIVVMAVAVISGRRARL